MTTKTTSTLALTTAALWLVGSAAAFDLGSFGNALNNAVQANQQQQAQRNAQPAARTRPGAGLTAGTPTDTRQVVYEGYTKTMLPIKAQIASGDIRAALQQKQAQYPKPDAIDVLGNMELGMMALDADQVGVAQQYFAKAEKTKIEQKEEKGSIGGFFSGLANAATSTISGDAESGEYEGPGFERVLMLNYKSIAHMLEGDRKAYNVTRRAIDLQNIEKAAFDAKVREAKSQLSEKKAKQSNNPAAQTDFDKILNDQYRQTASITKKVPSAFVNPFGFYMAGVVQEIDSYDDKSLRSNARISYKKALELNPKSTVIKQAVAAMKKPAPSNKRLVQVVVGDGFAPEKKLLKFDLSFGTGTPLNIELPLYEPVPSKVARVEAQTTSGKRWSRLYEVADITALALRYQKDASPISQLTMMTTVLRNVVEGQAWNQAQKNLGAFGSMLDSVKSKRDEMSHPDMRAWSTLPSRLLAARFYVPKSVSRFKLVAYDRKGRVLSSKLVKLDNQSHNFVYARSVDKTLYTDSSDKLWVPL